MKLEKARAEAEIGETSVAEIKEIEGNGYRVLYAVMRLNTEVSIVNPITGKEEDIKLAGGGGYIPVYSTLKEAEESARQGGYKILAIQEQR